MYSKSTRPSFMEECVYNKIATKGKLIHTSIHGLKDIRETTLTTMSPGLNIWVLADMFQPDKGPKHIQFMR